MFYTRSSFINYLQRVGCQLTVDNSDWRKTFEIKFPPKGTSAYIHTIKKDRIHFGEITIVVGRLQCPLPGDNDLELYED